MATSDAEQPGLLVTAALAAAVLAERWLRGRSLLLTWLLSLVAMVEALSAQTAAWAAIGAVAVLGASIALFGPLLGPWGPSRTWLIMLTTATFDLGVILVLVPP